MEFLAAVYNAKNEVETWLVNLVGFFCPGIGRLHAGGCQSAYDRPTTDKHIRNCA